MANAFVRAVGMGALALLFFVSASTALAQSTDELQAQIKQHNDQIAALDKEIAQYEAQLQLVGAKKQTLQSTIDQLNLQRKKLVASITATQNKISATGLEIKQLAQGIAAKETSIEKEESALGESIRRLNEHETTPLVVSVLTAENLSAAWIDADQTRALQDAINENIDALNQEKKSLADSKVSAEGKQQALVQQKQTLAVQQGSLDATKKAQSELLTQTKAQESNYQAIIAQKRAQEAAFEQALNDLQSKLDYAVNPSQIPSTGKGILSWPLANVRVTQYFGNTAFALSGAYNGKGHNGIDLAASIGTPIKAALTGTVLGTGNTDLVRGCYSFGKWVMVKHGNGLATMYAHLSQILVSSGQSVATGEVLGYSGQTGYATGPHLHFGVYVASAVQILKLGQATNQSTPCANVVMPVAPLSGYLNPIDYLPG